MSIPAVAFRNSLAIWCEVPRPEEAKAGRLVAQRTELRAYIANNEGALIDYGQRYRAGKPISTSQAEGTVNHL